MREKRRKKAWKRKLSEKRKERSRISKLYHHSQVKNIFFRSTRKRWDRMRKKRRKKACNEKVIRND